METKKRLSKKEANLWKEYTPEKRRELRAEWREQRKERDSKQLKHFVFFGDGQFAPGGKGNTQSY